MKEANSSPDRVLENIEMEKRLSKIKHTLVVLSGKGGVGKSTTAANLAMSLALSGQVVGLLDIDFHGPSIPKLMGLENKSVQVNDNVIFPIQFGENLKVMSLGLLLQGDEDAVIWRGPMKMGVIQQLIKDVQWGELDYLIIDSPPGTGDEPLSVVQLLKKPTGAVIVTQPQDISISDVNRSITFCEKVNLPVLGLVENMSGFICPHCGESVDVFKTGGGQALAKKKNIPFLGRIPLDPNVVKASDEGTPFVYAFSKTQTAKQFESLVEKLIQIIEEKKTIKKETGETMSDRVVRYAVPTADGKLCMHFGHCEEFALIDYDNTQRKVVHSQRLTPPPHEPGILPQWLHEQNVSVVLAGGMGSRAQNLFTQKGIKVVTGAQGENPDELVVACAQGKLDTGENVCDH